MNFKNGQKNYIVSFFLEVYLKGLAFEIGAILSLWDDFETFVFEIVLVIVCKRFSVWI